MVKDDGEAAKPEETLESPNPDAPNLPCPGDSQIGEAIERGPRVSADEVGGGGGDDGDDMSVTLAQLSSKRVGKKQLKSAAEEPSKSGDVDGDVDDSLTLRRSRRKRVDVDSGDGSKKLNLDGDGEEEEEEEDDDDDEEEEEESEFSVGDFVWGKVKSHPWWPGRVFDPSDASEQALKYKHEGRILVAYFGDATFAWCDPSQLQPFVENFAEMSKQSVSKSFINAVEEAVSEFGRLVELDMTCYCTPTSSERSGHDQMSALNAGIKGGVNVNKGGIGIYSVDRFDPAAFLSDLRIVGKHGSVGNLLELTTLKSWVSAVYRAKDGPLLLKFNELQEAAEDEGVADGVEVYRSKDGPVEESVLLLSKRKVRSVAEIVYGDEKGSEDGAVGEVEKGVKPDSKSGSKKRRIADESLGDESLINLSGKRTKKLEDVPKGETDDQKKEGKRSSRMRVKGSLKPVVVVVESDIAAAFEESEMTPRTRERKRSKYLSPPYTNIEYYRQTAITSPKAVESSHVSQSGSTSVETLKEKLPKEDKSNGSVSATPRRVSSRKVVSDPTKSIASPNNVLSGIRSAARSGRLSKEGKSLKAVEGFLTSYRSSKYQNESTEIIKQRSDDEVLNEGRKSGKKSKTKNDKAKSKNKEKDGKRRTGTPQSAALVHLKFPPGYSLPSKDDLVALFGKFGELEASKTKVSKKSSSARFVFVRSSDAEDAYKSSKANSPFGAAEVTYRIRHLRGGKSEEKEADENGFLKDSTKSGSKKRTRLSKKQSVTSTSDGGLRLVKQKLEGMATMVAEANDGKMSSEMKSELEGKLKDLLEEVKALPA